MEPQPLFNDINHLSSTISITFLQRNDMTGTRGLVFLALSAVIFIHFLGEAKPVSSSKNPCLKKNCNRKLGLRVPKGHRLRSKLQQHYKEAKYLDEQFEKYQRRLRRTMSACDSTEELFKQLEKLRAPEIIRPVNPLCSVEFRDDFEENRFPRKISSGICTQSSRCGRVTGVGASTSCVPIKYPLLVLWKDGDNLPPRAAYETIVVGCHCVCEGGSNPAAELSPGPSRT